VKDKPFYDETNGGITLSGGEPTIQIDFVYNLLQECRKRGISTAIETSGFFKWDRFKKLLPTLDWVLFDLKIIDEKAHRDYCGQSNKLILENAQKLTHFFSNVIFRMPVIPSINDDKLNIQKTCQLMKRLGKKELHLVSYHKLGYGKYQMLGRTPLDKHIKPADHKVQLKVKKIIEEEGIIPIIS